MDLETGRRRDDLKIGDLDTVSELAFRGDGSIVRRGTRAGQTGWFVDGAASPLALPSNGNVRWSPSNTVAFQEAGETRVVMVGETASLRPIELERDVRAFEWSHDGRSLFVLGTDERGSASLVRIALPDGGVETVADELDAPLRAAALEVRPDERAVYLPLASAGALDLLARHDPDADRDLDIYELSLTTGARVPRVDSPMDDLSPRAVGDHLYWTRVEYHRSIVALSSEGGDTHLVAEGGQIPYWSHDGRLVAYTVGLPRAADAPLNMDADTIAVDADARPISEPTRVVAWSPVGDEIAIENDAGDGRHSIWILELAGGSAELVVEYDSDTYSGLDWLPDGQTLVYAALADGRYQLFSVSRSGGVPERLSDDPGNLMQPQVSPDGRWIAATRVAFTRELWRQRR